MSVMTTEFLADPILRKALVRIVREKVVSSQTLAKELGVRFDEANGVLKKLAEFQLVVPSGSYETAPFYKVSPKGYEVAEEIQFGTSPIFGLKRG